MRKNKILLIGMILLIIGFTSFGIKKDKEIGHSKKNVSCKSSFKYWEQNYATRNFDKVELKNMNYEIRGVYKKPISDGKIKKALTIKDIIQNYPSSWIDECESIEIRVEKNGEIEKGISTGEQLNKEQISILRTAIVGSDIQIKVNYRRGNTITKELEYKQMNLIFTVIPETEAKYPKGKEVLIKQLKEQGQKQLAKYAKEQVDFASISFIVNEKGEIDRIRLNTSSGNDDVDTILLSIIREMPQWIPAKDGLGNFVEQEFLFSTGIDGC